jgi:hypothetical protein
VAGSTPIFPAFTRTDTRRPTRGIDSTLSSIRRHVEWAEKLMLAATPGETCMGSKEGGRIMHDGRFRYSPLIGNMENTAFHADDPFSGVYVRTQFTLKSTFKGKSPVVYESQ